MQFGIVVPQGLTGEYAGWEPAAAWARTLAVGRQAEDLGFQSVWVFDHVGTFGTLRDEPVFEAFAVLGALAAATHRVRLGPLVARAGLRNPALLAKHVSTLDVISGGRIELGLGAGATREEALAYGYEFNPVGERMALLRETLEVVRPMLAEGRATFAGERVRVDGALNNPRGLQSPRIPLIIGGNGATTRRLAALYADELNLDGPSPEATAEHLAAIRATCEDVGRDPDSLVVSVHLLIPDIAPTGSSRVRLLAAYRALGIPRLMALFPHAAGSDNVLEELARDAAEAGVELAG